MKRILLLFIYISLFLCNSVFADDVTLCLKESSCSEVNSCSTSHKKLTIKFSSLEEKSHAIDDCYDIKLIINDVFNFIEVSPKIRKNYLFSSLNQYEFLYTYNLNVYKNNTISNSILYRKIFCLLI